MKRPTKKSADVDLRGRKRREPRIPPIHPEMIEARFLDGPLRGQTNLVPRGEDFIVIGAMAAPLFVYSFAGKDAKKIPLYCQVPIVRKEFKLVRWYIAKFGKDPRALRGLSRQEPIRHNGSRKNQGAAKRAFTRLKADHD